MSRKRQRAYRAGLWGERLAALMLMVKGYRLLHMRQRTGAGEIDLIARRGMMLVFAEVKTRRGGATADAVHPAQASRLVRAGNAFLGAHPQYDGMAVRFDVILTGGIAWPQHIKSAWQADSDSKTAIF